MRECSHHPPSLIPSVALASFSASCWEGKGPINSSGFTKDNEHQNQPPSFSITLKLGPAASAICCSIPVARHAEHLAITVPIAGRLRLRWRATTRGRFRVGSAAGRSPAPPSTRPWPRTGSRTSGGTRRRRRPRRTLLALGRPKNDPAARVHRRLRSGIEGSQSVRELGTRHARRLSRCPKAMSEADRYTLVVRARANRHHPRPWSWEICRDGEPLPARLREDGYKTEYTATAAGSVAPSP
jgi:hypothetical protein